MQFERCDGGCGKERVEHDTSFSDWITVFVSTRNERNIRCRKETSFCPACWPQIERHLIAAAKLQVVKP